MTESLHAILMKYVDHSDADDVCQEICGWLMRNYDSYNYDKDTIEIICDDIWQSCREADKAK